MLMSFSRIAIGSWAFSIASSGATSSRFTRLIRWVSIVIMPSAAPVWMSEAIRKVLFSRMSDAIEVVLTMIS